MQKILIKAESIIGVPTNREGRKKEMYSRKNIVSTKDARANFFKNSNDKELDEFTFNMWKSELEKELPNFWESMSELRRR